MKSFKDLGEFLIDLGKMLVPTTQALEIIIRTFVVYLVVVIGLRVFGKRELGQMTPCDLVLILTLSNSVQNAMTGPDTSLTGGLISASTLLLSNWLLGTFGVRIPAVRKWLTGSPTLLVHNGKLIPAHMRREGVEEDELIIAAREHGIDDLKEVKEAILEVDGSISIIPKDAKSPTSRRRRRRFRKMP
jgi:uncharacterized membrane protein YcaP (DUF421 family)